MWRVVQEGFAQSLTNALLQKQGPLAEMGCPCGRVSDALADANIYIGSGTIGDQVDCIEVRRTGGEGAKDGWCTQLLCAQPGLLRSGTWDLRCYAPVSVHLAGTNRWPLCACLVVHSLPVRGKGAYTGRLGSAATACRSLTASCAS